MRAGIIQMHVTDTEDIALIHTGTGDDKTAAKHVDCVDQIPPQPLHLSALMQRPTEICVAYGR